ncbi:uncharacterized protein LOC101850079 [Aplysia californica]|uniref:Uncharacterized protein LOC101850079 n=1 Tax=Aplysia californica TaxID=6500 RepID=A0ABM0JM92_APLCA|nr:uncharacterized protein LOC101850079 [Aplysia californica]
MALCSEIGNHTGSTCWAEVKLKLHVTYLASGKFKQEKKVVSTVQKEQIPRGKSFSWKENLRIPSLPPSQLKGCKLIKTQYILQFRVGSDARCSCDNIEFEDEIIIGTFPLVTKMPTPVKVAKAQVDKPVPNAVLPLTIPAEEGKVDSREKLV